MFGQNTSGLEMALRSMGLGSVLDAAKSLAESGAVQKIVAHADGLEELNARVARMERTLSQIAKLCGADEPEIIDGEARLIGSPEPGSGPSNSAAA